MVHSLIYSSLSCSHAQSYADVFDDNRIRPTMLLDLSKEILQVWVKVDSMEISRGSFAHVQKSVFLYWM